MSHPATFAKVLGTAASALLCISAAAPAQAFTWNYSWDSLSDGTGDFLTTSGFGIGEDSKYEIFGTAYGYDRKNDKVFFALNSNISLLGHASTNAKDGNIGWGDLFLNLDPTKSFAEVQGTSSLLGIRFAGTNDSGIDPTTNGGSYTYVTEQVPKLDKNGKQVYVKGVPQFTTVKVYETNPDGSYLLDKNGNKVQKKINASNGVTGIYQGVTAKNVTSVNNGWGSYSAYDSYVGSKKGTVELIDGMTLTDSQNYLGNHGYSVIGSAQEKIGDINLLDSAALASLGVNFGEHTGAQVFGFSFDRSVLPEGNLSWIQHIMAECANDTTGGMGSIQDVPEPAGLGSLAVIGMMLGGSALRRRQAGKPA